MMKNTKKKLSYFLATAAMVTVIASCTPTVHTRGAYLKPHDLEKVVVGTSTKDDVQKALGSPSTVSSFYDNTWYYVGSLSEDLAFYKPQTMDQQVIQITFDEIGTVTNIYKVDQATAEKIDPVGRKTATAGNELTVIQQIVGNVGRFKGETKSPVKKY